MHGTSVRGAKGWAAPWKNSSRVTETALSLGALGVTGVSPQFATLSVSSYTLINGEPLSKSLNKTFVLDGKWEQ